MAQNYTLGRGEIWFAPFKTGTQTPGGERYFGNTPALSLSADVQALDHFNSDAGIKEKDDSITLQVTRTGSFTCDNIDPKNLALWLFGSYSVQSQAATAVTDEPLNDVEVGLTYQLGVSDTNPTGVTKVGSVTVSKAASALTLNTDYTVDTDTGRVTILSGGAVSNGDDLTVDYTPVAITRDHVLSGKTPIEGALRFIAKNPKGEQFNYFMPWCKLTPNGEFALKGDDWQTIPFNIEALVKGTLAALYVDGAPVTA